jgi:hypothetical protein
MVKSTVTQIQLKKKCDFLKCNFFFPSNHIFLRRDFFHDLHYLSAMETDMADAKTEGGDNPFGLSAAEWKFYQFVRASPKVTSLIFN